jgi:uncharacterized protein (TIGR04222 family)
VNPLDFTGPEFLRFYLVYGSAILLAAGLLRLFWSGSSTPLVSRRWSPGAYPGEDDAYAIALLRGGPREVVRALLCRLVADGLLTLDGCTLRRPDESPRERSLAPLEEAALSALRPAAGPENACLAVRRAAQVLAPQIAELRRELEQEGLVPGESRRRTQRGIMLGTFLFVCGLGLAKLAVALARGRTNVAYLILLLIVYGAACLFLLRPPLRTAAGRRYLDWLRGSHQGLVRMVSQGRREGVGELALAAGIYGLAALPTFTPLRNALEPQAARRNDGDAGGSADSGGTYSGCSSGDSGGASCGSGDSGGASCSSGDGGGASSCGGGCGGGGCGGCGGG